MEFVWQHLWGCQLQQGNPMSRNCCMDHRYSPYYPFSERNNFIEHKISMLFQELSMIFKYYSYIQNHLLQNMVQFIKAKQPELLQQLVTIDFIELPVKQNLLQCHCNPIAIQQRNSICRNCPMNHVCSPDYPLSERNSFIEHKISMLLKELGMISRNYSYIRNYLLQNLVTFINEEKQSELLQVYKNNVCFLLIYKPTCTDTHLLT